MIRLFSRFEDCLMQKAQKIAGARSGPSAGSCAAQVSLYVEKLNFVYTFILIYLRLRRGYKSVDIEVCYGSHSPYARFVSLLPKFLLMSLGFRLTLLGEGDSVPNYPHVHARAMELTAELTRALIPILRKDVYYGCLESLLEDSDSTSSYVCKYVARYTLFPVVREVLVWRQLQLNRDPKPRTLAVMPLSWPIEWRLAMKEHLLGDEIEIALAQLCLPINFAFKIWLVARFSLALIKRVLANGIGCTKIGGGKIYRLIREFTDPRTLGGRAQDNDYLVNGDQLHPEDILFYITPHQDRNILAKLGSKEQILNALKSKGYEVVYLSELELPRAMLWRLIRFIFHSSLKLFGSLGGEYLVANALISGFKEYLQFAPFFHQVAGEVHFSFIHPPGWTGFRSNNGLLTALCRQRGVLSASYQTRAYQGRFYEYGFEALDLFLMWGPAWKDFIEPYLMYVKHVEYIGDIFVDDLVSTIGADDRWQEEPSGRAGINIALLTCDIDKLGTVAYNMRLLNAACRIAERHPEVKLIAKPKEPEHWGVFLKDKQFSTYTQALGDRLSVRLDPRHHTEKVISLSDLLLVSGFTTPGVDALLSGKRVIYYDETGCADHLYGQVPKLLAKSVEEMEHLVDEALHSTENYHSTYSRQLDELDPYRDGRASQRIYWLLYKSNEEANVLI